MQVLYRLVKDVINAIVIAEFCEAPLLVSHAHKYERLSELMGTTSQGRPLVIIACMEELSDLLDDVDARSLWHFELRDEQVYCLQALVLYCISHDKIYGGQTRDKELDRALVAKFYQQQLGCLKVHKLIIQYNNRHLARINHLRHHALVLTHSAVGCSRVQI